MNVDQINQIPVEPGGGATSSVRAGGAPQRLDPRATLTWLLGFSPVLYLALRGGGYDLVIRSEVGLGACWIVMLGALAGVLPVARLGRLAWVCVGLLAAFAAWTAVAVSWSESAEQTVTELGRVSTYLGVFVLALVLLRRDTLRSLVSGIGVAFGVVSVLAVLSRLAPGAFPTDPLASFFAKSNVRLSYPLNYASGTGNLLAIGIPLLLMIATRARTLAGQAAGAAVLPIAALGVVMTASRGGAATAIIGIVAFYALAPDRLPKLATGLLAGIGSAILVAALLHNRGVRNGLSTPLALTQRHQMLALIVAVCAVVALAQIGIGLLAQYRKRPRRLRFSRRAAGITTLGGLAVACVVAVALGVPGQLSHQWDLFKQEKNASVASGNVYNRLATVTGSHRYQYWSAAIDAFKSKPLTGIGPGSFEFWWAQHGSIYEYIRNAHSLYLETLAETGPVGFVLLVGFMLAVLGAGVARALRAPPPRRAILAGATASFAAFLAAAAYDWVWQLAVIPVAALVLAAAILVDGEKQASAAPARPRRLWPRASVGVLAALAMIAIAIPFATTAALRSSQGDAAVHDYTTALDDAATAQALEPYAASPRLQRALILEAAGELHGARSSIIAATTREPTNWQLWLIRARIEAEGGLAAAAVADYHRAHELDPRSPATAQ